MLPPFLHTVLLDEKRNDGGWNSSFVDRSFIPVQKDERRRQRTSGINWWLTSFVIATFLLQVLLIPPQLFAIRTYLRIAMFAGSLAMLFIVPGRMRILPITTMAMLIVAIICLGLLHPETNSPLSAAGSIMLNFAIISPIFWVPRLKMDAEQFRKALILIWAFHAMSAAFGILEIYYPSYFGRESKITAVVDKIMVEGLQITLADGTQVYRPMGLSDSPGGAAASGYLAVLMACGLLTTRTNWAIKLGFLLSIVAGFFCIYLCQVRSLLILAAICIFTMVAIMTLRGQIGRVVFISIIVGILVSFATIWALKVGGTQVTDRLATLIEGSAGDIYYANRGKFLEETIFQKVPEYPLGAGLGRWGMNYLYFGDKSSNASTAIWAEIQPTAWILDGGVPLLICYYAAVVLCTLYAAGMAFRRKGTIADLATVVLTLNLAVLANTFSYIPFIGQSGLTFWLMNGCLMALTLTDDRKRRAQRARRKLSWESLNMLRQRF